MSDQEINALRDELRETRQLIEDFKAVVGGPYTAVAPNPLGTLFSPLQGAHGTPEVSLENFRVKLAEYLNNLKEPYIVTKYGDPLAVVVPYKLYRSMLLELTESDAQAVMSRPKDVVYDDDEDGGEEENPSSFMVNEP